MISIIITTFFASTFSPVSTAYQDLHDSKFPANQTVKSTAWGQSRESLALLKVKISSSWFSISLRAFKPTH